MQKRSGSSSLSHSKRSEGPGNQPHHPFHARAHNSRRKHQTQTMRSTLNIVRSALFCAFFLTHRAESLNMTVVVTLNSQSSSTSLLCSLSLSLLNLLQPLLTLLVIQATLPAIPDFAIPGGLVLNYRNPYRRRMLRAFESKKEELEDARSLKTPKKMYTCTSSGCAAYSGAGTCSLCASSRRLSADKQNAINPMESSTSKDLEDVESLEDMRKLYLVDFDALGTQVSATVQVLLQSYLLTQSVDLLGCLGDPLFLKAQVAFLLN